MPIIFSCNHSAIRGYAVYCMSQELSGGKKYIAPIDFFRKFYPECIVGEESDDESDDEEEEQ